MNVQVLFFGATADIVGQRGLEVELPTNAISSQVIEKLVADFPDLAKHRLLISVNHHYAVGSEMLAEGDEIAVFTAVSGG